MTRESEHTPGPWLVLEVMGRKFVAAKPPEDSPFHGHTRFQDIGGDEDYPRKDADLALEAAAPDLLSALKAAGEFIRGNEVCCELPSFIATVGAIEQALEKAQPAKEKEK